MKNVSDRVVKKNKTHILDSVHTGMGWNICYTNNKL